MFAAMPSDTLRRLEYFRLALQLVDRGSAHVPTRLSEHFDQVLSQARILVVDPTAVTLDVIPQAVHLANDMRRGSALRDALDGIAGLADISPMIAHNVLCSLDPNFASSD